MSHFSLTRRGFVLKKKYVEDSEKRKLHRDLTFKPKVIPAFQPLSKPIPFSTYLESDLRLYLPRYYALEKYGPPKKDHLSENITPTDFQVHWSLLPHQKTAWEKMKETFTPEGGGGILSLPCGFGKSNCAIRLASYLKAKTIIVVAKEFLQKQWIEAIKECSDAKVGIIQGPKVDVENKDIVVAMLQSLSMKDYPDEILQDFGLCVFDECFPYAQEIATELGPTPIGKIYKLWNKQVEHEQAQAIWDEYVKTQLRDFNRDVEAEWAEEQAWREEYRHLGKKFPKKPVPKGKLKPPKKPTPLREKFVLPLVKAFNTTTGEIELKQVTHAWKKSTQELIELNLDGNLIRCTPNHLFCTLANNPPSPSKPKHQWIPASELKKDTQIQAGYHRNIPLSKGKPNLKVYHLLSDPKPIKLKKPLPVYDIEVEDHHNFIICHKANPYGTVVHNCHHIGSQIFSKALSKVASKWTLGLSATPIRKDGLTKVFLNYLGPIFYSERRSGHNKVWCKILEISSPSPHYKLEIMASTGTKDTGKMITNISKYEAMNYLILEVIRILIASADRQILILGARRDQLEWLNEKCNELAFKTHDGKYAKSGLYYGNIKMNKKVYWKMMEESSKCDIIWGTNEIAKEGLDIKGLNTLLLLSGGTDVEQAVGRILRKIHENTPPTVIDFVYKCGNFPRHGKTRADYYESEDYLIQKHQIALEDTDSPIPLYTPDLTKFLNSYPDDPKHPSLWMSNKKKRELKEQPTLKQECEYTNPDSFKLKVIDPNKAKTTPIPKLAIKFKTKLEPIPIPIVKDPHLEDENPNELDSTTPIRPINHVDDQNYNKEEHESRSDEISFDNSSAGSDEPESTPTAPVIPLGKRTSLVKGKSRFGGTPVTTIPAFTSTRKNITSIPAIITPIRQNSSTPIPSANIPNRKSKFPPTSISTRQNSKSSSTAIVAVLGPPPKNRR